MSRFDRYVGLVYARDGRGPDEFDCVGLCQHVYRSELGIELPDALGTYQPATARPRDGSLVDSTDARWAKILPQDAQPFDIVLIRERPWHVGIVVMPSFMLHMPADRESIIERFDTTRHASRVDGLYRHPSRNAR